MKLDIPTLLQNIQPEIFFKIVFLILIGLYTIFIGMLLVQLRSLRKIVLFPSRGGSMEIQIFAILYLTAIIALFIATIFIV